RPGLNISTGPAVSVRPPPGRRCQEDYMHLTKLGASALGAGIVALLTGSAFAQVAPYPGADELPELRLSATDYNPATVPAGQAMQAYADYVKAASNGKIQVEIFWSGSLMGP